MLRSIVIRGYRPVTPLSHPTTATNPPAASTYPIRSLILLTRCLVACAYSSTQRHHHGWLWHTRFVPTACTQRTTPPLSLLLKGGADDPLRSRAPTSTALKPAGSRSADSTALVLVCAR